MYPSGDGCAQVNGYAKGFEARARGANLSPESSVGCHCKPEACHGDVIAEYLNSYEDDDGAVTDDY